MRIRASAHSRDQLYAAHRAALQDLSDDGVNTEGLEFTLINEAALREAEGAWYSAALRRVDWDWRATLRRYRLRTRRWGLEAAVWHNGVLCGC